MSSLIIWHRDTEIEMQAAEALTRDITDPDTVDSLTSFLNQVADVVDNATPHERRNVTTGSLPWRSRTLESPVSVEGPHGPPVTAPTGGHLEVSCAMTIQLRPRALRSHRPSYVMSEVHTVITVRSSQVDNIGQLVVPLMGGKSFVEPSGLPLPGSLGSVVEALASAAFPEEIRQARFGASSFDEWDELCRHRTRRLRLWQVHETDRSIWPSRAAHELAVPADLFVRPDAYVDRPSGRSVPA